MIRIFDYLILSLVLAIMFCCYGYIFTTASMVCLYATVYAMVEEDNEEDNKTSP